MNPAAESINISFAQAKDGNEFHDSLKAIEGKLASGNMVVQLKEDTLVVRSATLLERFIDIFSDAQKKENEELLSGYLKKNRVYLESEFISPPTKFTSEEAPLTDLALLFKSPGISLRNLALQTLKMDNKGDSGTLELKTADNITYRIHRFLLPLKVQADIKNNTFPEAPKASHSALDYLQAVLYKTSLEDHKLNFMDKFDLFRLANHLQIQPLAQDTLNDLVQGLKDPSLRENKDYMLGLFDVIATSGEHDIYNSQLQLFRDHLDAAPDSTKKAFGEKITRELQKDEPPYDVLILGLKDKSTFGIATSLEPKEIMEKIEKHALRGHPSAQREVGLSYYWGRYGFDKNPEKAFQFIDMSANNGMVVSQGTLGYFYLRGIGVEKNYDEAEKWLTRAADQKNIDAKFDLGEHYFLQAEALGNDASSKELAAKAVYYLKSAAAEGYSGAQVLLGRCYLEGPKWGLVRDNVRAVAWFQKAHDAGNSEGTYYLSQCYKRGLGSGSDEEISNRMRKAPKLLEEAANKGYEQARIEYVADFLSQYVPGVENIKTLIKDVEPLAAKGNPAAQFLMGRLCGIMFDHEIKNKKATEALAWNRDRVDWYKKAAEAASPEANYKLYEMAAKPMAIKNDAAQKYIVEQIGPKENAIVYLENAAELELPEAQFEYAKWLMEVRMSTLTAYPIATDFLEKAAKALELYEKAALAGNKQAHDALWSFCSAYANPYADYNIRDWMLEFRRLEASSPITIPILHDRERLRRAVPDLGY